MSTLKSRNQTPIISSGQTVLAPIQLLDPDYALSVSYKVGDPILKKHLEALLDKLYASGFYVQVRPKTLDDGLLVFVKLSSAKLNELKSADALKNFEFDVPEKVLTDDQTSRIIADYFKLLTAEYTIVQGIISLAQEPTSGSLERRYGSEVAFYFEFLQNYIVWLASLSVIGLISYFKSKHRYLMSYTIINLIWGVLFLTFWKQKESLTAKLWGTFNVLQLSLKSAEINKPGSVDVTRFLKQLAFIPVALGFTAILVTFQLCCFVLEIFLLEIYDGPGKIVITLLPTILLLVFVPVFTIVYDIAANYFIKWEGHVSDVTKSNSQLVKNWVLKFLTGFNPLLITSFIYLPFAHLIKPILPEIESHVLATFGKGSYLHYYLSQVKRQEDFRINQERLNSQYYYFIVTNKIIAVVLKYVLPLAIKYVKENFLKKNAKLVKDRPDEAKFLTEVRKQADLPVYNVNEDYSALVLQYGYLIVFGPVWLLAPLVLLLFTLATYFLDLKKLESGLFTRRVIPTRADGIQTWNTAMFAFTWIGSVVGPAITAFYRHGTQPPKSIGALAFDKASVNATSTHVFFILFVVEHIFLISVFIIQKLAGLADKSDKEVLLRRDVYAKNEAPVVAAEKEASPWVDYDVSTALADAEWRGVVTEGEAPGKSESANSVSSVSSQKEVLGKVKLATDSYVEKNGKVSTIDDNSHFAPPEIPAETKSVDGSGHVSKVSSNNSSPLEEIILEASRDGAKIDAEAEARAEKVINVANERAESFVQETKEKAEAATEKIERKKSSIKKIFTKKK